MSWEKEVEEIRRRRALAALHGGTSLAPLLAGLSWYRSLRAGSALMPALLRAAGVALLAWPVQTLAIALALGLLLLGRADLGRLWLDHGVWVALAAIGLLAAQRAARRDRGIC